MNIDYVIKCFDDSNYDSLMIYIKQYDLFEEQNNEILNILISQVVYSNNEEVTLLKYLIDIDQNNQLDYKYIIEKTLEIRSCKILDYLLMDKNIHKIKFSETFFIKSIENNYKYFSKLLLIKYSKSFISINDNIILSTFLKNIPNEKDYYDNNYHFFDSMLIKILNLEEFRSLDINEKWLVNNDLKNTLGETFLNKYFKIKEKSILENSAIIEELLLKNNETSNNEIINILNNCEKTKQYSDLLPALCIEKGNSDLLYKLDLVENFDLFLLENLSIKSAITKNDLKALTFLYSKNKSFSIINNKFSTIMQTIELNSFDTLFFIKNELKTFSNNEILQFIDASINYNSIQTLKVFIELLDEKSKIQKNINRLLLLSLDLNNNDIFFYLIDKFNIDYFSQEDFINIFYLVIKNENFIVLKHMLKYKELNFLYCERIIKMNFKNTELFSEYVFDGSLDINATSQTILLFAAKNNLLNIIKFLITKEFSFTFNNNELFFTSFKNENFNISSLLLENKNIKNTIRISLKNIKEDEEYKNKIINFLNINNF
jgi:hypothetical protein